MTTKTLRDKVLPQPLQDRKEIDDLITEAETHLDKGVQALERLKGHVSAAAGAVVGLFPERKVMMQTLKLDVWPPVFPEPKPDAWHSSRISVGQIKQLRHLMHQHNIQAERILTKYLELLEKVNEKIRHLNLGTLADGPVIGGGGRLQHKPLDIIPMAQTAKIRCRPLPLLPEDTIPLIQNYWKKERPSFWERLIKN